MEILTLKDPKVLGEEHPQYGYQIWSLTDGDYPVMFNTKKTNIMPDTRITFESSEKKTSHKGTEYLRLKKVQFEEAHQDGMPFSDKKDAVFKAEASNAYQRDITPIALDVWRGIKEHWDIRTVHSNPDEAADLYDAVAFHTNELLGMIENVRTNGIVKDSGYDQAKKTAKKIKESTEIEDDIDY